LANLDVVIEGNWQNPCLRGVGQKGEKWVVDQGVGQKVGGVGGRKLRKRQKIQRSHTKAACVEGESGTSSQTIPRNPARIREKSELEKGIMDG